MYEILAAHYDSLVEDKEATRAYVKFTLQHSKPSKTLELACGSGEISLQLAKAGYVLLATDISKEMLDVARKKDPTNLVDYQVMDMTKFNINKSFDTILCYCDSINYLQQANLKDMFSEVHKHLNVGGIFLFDMHTLDRLQEFEEEFYEAGVVDGCEYVWSIQSEDYLLYHSFVFYDENGKASYEHHVQQVFEPEYVKHTLEMCGFQVEIYTDFDSVGIQAGEKHFFVCRKEQK